MPRIILITLLILPLCFSAQAETDPKFNTLRLENEVIFDIPLEQTENVWAWMQSKFSNGWTSNNLKLQTFKDIEQFADTYFDTRSLVLINQANGLRHRRRFYPNGDVKELIQFKQSSLGNKNDFSSVEQTRNELKYDLAYPTVIPGLNQDYNDENIETITKKSHRPLLNEHLAPYQIDISELLPIVSIRQERRRIYFRDNGKQLFTLTLDIAKPKKGFLTTDFSQLDIEIGELAFTNSNENERSQLLKVQEDLRKLLLTDLPFIKRNQTPKILMAKKTFEDTYFLGRIIFQYGDLLPVLILMILFLALITLIPKKKAE